MVILHSEDHYSGWVPVTRLNRDPAWLNAYVNAGGISVTDRIVCAMRVMLRRPIAHDGIGLGEAAYTPS